MKHSKRITTIAERLYPDITTEELDSVLELVGPNAKTSAEILVEYAIGRQRAKATPEKLTDVFNSILEKRYGATHRVIIEPKRKTAERIAIDAVLQAHRADYVVLMTGDRHEPYPDCRKAICHILVQYLKFTDKEAGKILNIDRTSSIAARAEHDNQMETRPLYRDRFNKAMEIIEKTAIK